MIIYRTFHLPKKKENIHRNRFVPKNSLKPNLKIFYYSNSNIPRFLIFNSVENLNGHIKNKRSQIKQQQQKSNDQKIPNV